MARRGKTSTGWFYGFKLHLIINERGEILAYKLTPGNINDRVPVPGLSKDLFGKLFGDKGYISQELFIKLYEKGLEIITRLKKNMKNKLMKLIDKILLRSRGVIESVNNKLKSDCQIEHHRHRSPLNFLVNLISGIVAYAYDRCKPTVQLTRKKTAFGRLLSIMGFKPVFDKLAYPKLAWFKKMQLLIISFQTPILRGSLRLGELGCNFHTLLLPLT